MQSPVSQPINPDEQYVLTPPYRQPQFSQEFIQSPPSETFQSQAVVPSSTQFGRTGRPTFRTPVSAAPSQPSGSSPVGPQLPGQPTAGFGQVQWSEWESQPASSGPTQPGSELGAGPSQAQFGSAEIPPVDLFEEADEFIVLVDLQGTTSMRSNSKRRTKASALSPSAMRTSKMRSTRYSVSS